MNFDKITRMLVAISTMAALACDKKDADRRPLPPPAEEDGTAPAPSTENASEETPAPRVDQPGPGSQAAIDSGPAANTSVTGESTNPANDFPQVETTPITDDLGRPSLLRCARTAFEANQCRLDPQLLLPAQGQGVTLRVAFHYRCQAAVGNWWVSTIAVQDMSDNSYVILPRNARSIIRLQGRGPFMIQDIEPKLSFEQQERPDCAFFVENADIETAAADDVSTPIATPDLSAYSPLKSQVGTNLFSCPDWLGPKVRCEFTNPIILAPAQAQASDLVVAYNTDCRGAPLPAGYPLNIVVQDLADGSVIPIRYNHQETLRMQGRGPFVLVETLPESFNFFAHHEGCALIVNSVLVTPEQVTEDAP